MEQASLKLHLGCGERYIPGYRNIDFPPDFHNVQQVSVADQHTDILSLRYDRGSIAEVRCHHVFEHFPRAVACALVSCWCSWLEAEGVLHIEVPDLGRVAMTLLNPLASIREKAVAERHAFGSHEASWAHHYEGYSLQSLRALLTAFGFKEARTTRNCWKGTHNIEVISRKTLTAKQERSDFERAAEGYLRNFLVDESPGEERLLQVWMEIYREQVDKGWPAA